MKKIIVIGSGGAGKSTFSLRLGAATGIEVIHLDRLFWKPGWIETPNDEWSRIVEEALNAESWIMDGNFGGTREMRMQACDTIIFLDVPRLVCIWRVLKRWAVYRKKSRPDMAEGCAERFDWKFLDWIWNYPKKSKPTVEKLLKQFAATKKIFVFGSNKAAEKFLRHPDLEIDYGIERRRI